MRVHAVRVRVRVRVRVGVRVGVRIGVRVRVWVASISRSFEQKSKKVKK